MASSARIFFAGVATTFAILAAGFGGGIMLAKSALHEQPAQTRASTEPPAPARVILATTPAPAVRAPEPTASEPKAQIQPEPQVTAVPAQVEKTDPKKAERESRALRKRIAERKARKIAAARARMEAQQPQQTPSILAFGGDQSRAGGFFGN